VLSTSLALALGAQFHWAGGTLVRPYVRGGATFFDNTDFALETSFAGSPGGIGPKPPKWVDPSTVSLITPPKGGDGADN
jgi:hypothetical protein